MSLSVAGAIKKILDTPILDRDGKLADESETTHKEVCASFPEASKSTQVNSNASDLTNSSNVDLTSEKIHKQVFDLIDSFLQAAGASMGKSRNSFGETTLQRLLRVFRASNFNESIDDIIGLYDPSAMNCLTGDYSGILFTKDQMYYLKDKKGYSIPIRYKNIRAVEEKFSSLIIYLRNGNPITFKGIMFSTSELARLLTDISEIFN